MNFKTVISSFTTLNAFIKNPLKFLKASKNGAVAVSNNNTLVMYAVSPHLLKKLFSIAMQFKNCNISKTNRTLYTNTFEKNYSNNTIPIRKFAMHNKWKPDIDFIRQASTWGITLQYSVKKEELKAFIDYWKVEGRFFYHIQWQQKLARNLEQHRRMFSITKNRSINQKFIPDKVVPDGFRDK
ncbi:primosomal protein DnaI [Buchnera aphidicola (Hormaphis cornu)]|nr:primosomal protein DnaI [Buchnera aphidicola (Hormaphis cornu)]